MKPDTLVDTQAERAVLGAALCDGRLSDAALGLTPADFGGQAEGLVFAAMCSLHGGNARIDHLTLTERLKTLGHLATVGGAGFLMALDSAVPLAANAAAYCATVRDRAQRRASLARARAVAADAKDLQRPISASALAASRDFAELATQGASDAQELGGSLVLALNERWDDFMHGRRSPYLSTGLPALEEAGFRGFVPNLNLVGGKASIGKTGFVSSVAWGWLEEGLPGCIFGLEDGVDWLVERHLSRHLGIPVGDVAAIRLHDYQAERCAEWSGKAYDMLNRLLRVHQTSGLDAPGLLAKAERWIRGGAKWLVIDHGGRIAHQSTNAKERYDLGITRTVEALDNLAHNTGVPIVVNWHFSREAAKREGPPTKEDFRESGNLENYAGTVLGLWERPANPGHLLVTVLKQRKGKRDVTVALPRDTEHALVQRTGGFLVDLRAEDEERAEVRPAPRRRTPLFTNKERQEAEREGRPGDAETWRERFGGEAP